MPFQARKAFITKFFHNTIVSLGNAAQINDMVSKIIFLRLNNCIYIICCVGVMYSGE